MARQIGEVANYEGSLEIYMKDGRFMWVITGYGEWGEQIPQYLYDALNKFEDEREK